MPFKLPAEKGFVRERRRLLLCLNGLFAGALAVATFLPVFGYLLGPLIQRRQKSSENWIELLALSSVGVGQPTEVTYLARKTDGWILRTEVRGAVILRTSADEVVVFSTTCPHLNCAVHWDVSRQQFVCPCHDGTFSQDGRVISGPPPRGLFRLMAKVEGDRVWIQESLR